MTSGGHDGHHGRDVQVVRALYELPSGGVWGGSRTEAVAIKAMASSDMAGMGGA